MGLDCILKMTKEINLYIEFSRLLDQEVNKEFWDEMISKIEDMNLKAGGKCDIDSYDLLIDYSDSPLERGNIMDKIGYFLMEKDDIVLNFKIE